MCRLLFILCIPFTGRVRYCMLKLHFKLQNQQTCPQGLCFAHRQAAKKRVYREYSFAFSFRVNILRKIPINSVLRIRDVFPDPNFSNPDPGSGVKKIKDPGSPSKNLSIFNPKLVSKLSEIWCSSRIRILIFYPSRIQGSKRHRIPDLHPQHWISYLNFSDILCFLLRKIYTKWQNIHFLSSFVVTKFSAKYRRRKKFLS
jgi:hypothetical protein